jgi:predicted RNA-binding Zn-ribbon protein involved in translation (DUF1610 family)
MDRMNPGNDDDTPRCPKCGSDLERELFEVDGHTHVAYRCPRHGVEAIGDDSERDGGR